MHLARRTVRLIACGVLSIKDGHIGSKDNKTPTSTTFLAMISAAVGTALVSFFAFLSTFAALSPLLTFAGFASPFAALAIAVVRRGRVVKERKGNEKPVKVPVGGGKVGGGGKRRKC